MRPKKLLATTCSVLLIVVLLAACGSQSTATTATPMPPPTASPSTPTPVPPTPEPAPAAEEPEPVASTGVTLTVVFDNTTTDPQLTAGWGFAAVVEYGGHTLLFDTGASGPVLLDNMRQLGIDPSSIEVVILSHEHGDHTDGLQALLDTGIQPTVYVPSAFPQARKDQVLARTELVEVSDAVEILPGVHTTRPMGGWNEQALVLESSDGAVVITGCAHMGLMSLVREAQRVAGTQIALLAGGFHLNTASSGEVQNAIDMFRQSGVEKVLPTHCTGDAAIALFRSDYGEDFIEGGVGRTVAIATN